MNSKEKRKIKNQKSLERVRDNPVLAHMRQIAYSPVSTQYTEEGDSRNINKSIKESDLSAIKKAEEKRLKRQERNIKHG